MEDTEWKVSFAHQLIGLLYAVTGKFLLPNSKYLYVCL